MHIVASAGTEKVNLLILPDVLNTQRSCHHCGCHNEWRHNTVVKSTSWAGV